jgi:hypothetical protein
MWPENEDVEPQNNNRQDREDDEDEVGEDDYDEAAAVQSMQQLAVNQAEGVPGSCYANALFLIRRHFHTPAMQRTELTCLVGGCKDASSLIMKSRAEKPGSMNI